MHCENLQKKIPAVNNPYRIALGLFGKRLLWDLNPESWRSRRILKNLKDAYLNKKAVILCNGPSLLQVDFDLLDDVFTFGLNKINLLFSKTTFRPSAIVSVNPYVLNQNKEFYRKTDIPLFIDQSALSCITPRQNIVYLHSCSYRKFARDCSLSIYQSHTVTFVALQLVFHMGFQKVAIVGCDHNFHVKGPENALVISEGPDRSHFDSNYFGAGTSWQLPDLFESEIGYMMARKIFEACGRKVVNATEGGRLEIFPRMKLQEFLKME